MFFFSGEDLVETDASLAIMGDDTESSIVLTVHTPLTGFVFDVEVVRIFKSSMKEINHIFEYLTLLKLNSVRNEPSDRSASPAASSREIADLAWQKISSVILDMLVFTVHVAPSCRSEAETLRRARYRDQCKLRKRVEIQAGLYADIRRHLDGG